MPVAGDAARDPGADGRATRFVARLGRFLEAMARRVQRPGSGPVPDPCLLRTRFVGLRYSLTLDCLWRRRPCFVVTMSEPWPQTFVVGRLLAHGPARVVVPGALLFMGHLGHQGLLDDFERDLEESLALRPTRPC